MKLWSRQTEITFFEKALKKHAPEKLFYALGEILCICTKKVDGEGQTLQSRNSLIGTYTEEWCKAFSNHSQGHGAVWCQWGCLWRTGPYPEKFGFGFCATPCTSQTPENIKLLFEIKIVSFQLFVYWPGNIIFVGDLQPIKAIRHRSDSMLKAIGKAINIRVSGYAASRIPIIVWAIVQ